MDLPTPQETSTPTEGYPPGTSVKASNSQGLVNVAATTATATRAEPTVNPSAAVAALRHPSQGIGGSKIDLTAEPDSVSLIGQPFPITHLQVLIAQDYRKLRESSAWSTPEYKALELRYHMTNGILEYMKQQEIKQGRMNSLQADNKMLYQTKHRLQADKGIMQETISRLQAAYRELDAEKKDYQKTAIRVERQNYTLRMEIGCLQAEIEDGQSLTGSDGEGPSRKRSRSGTESDIGDQSEKRVRTET
ncbi:hypothetical protein BJ875DRAFT_486038 [Amylocarpus encephaloides]|uniref:Uncharacterized protein n=1 Tax=Amylocarpus encephaloides TaxID=45428 RepID=A0A9P7YEY2_9HELO|nr:hypothetical protein BJ875DRAFT_486038 [Amylocarpus encephaloides]